MNATPALTPPSATAEHTDNSKQFREYLSFNVGALEFGVDLVEITTETS